jgi:hypothetical protein
LAFGASLVRFELHAQDVTGQTGHIVDGLGHFDAATLATAAARSGLRTLIVEVEGKSGLPSMFGQDDLGYDEVTMTPGAPADGRAEIRARTITPDEALLDYLADHGLQRVSKRLVNSGALDMVATAAPGIRDILVLGKIKQIEASGAFDLIVVDAPAAGHAITFLRSAAGLLDAVAVGPIHAQAADVVVADPARTGLGADGAQVLAGCGAAVLVLVSCDPVAGARDIGVLCELGYELECCEVLDLFPQTHHRSHQGNPGYCPCPHSLRRRQGNYLENSGCHSVRNLRPRLFLFRLRQLQRHTCHSETMP